MKTLRMSIVFVLFLLTSALIAQPYGKLYSRSDADKTYGPVLKQHKIKTAELQSIISKTNSILMFNFTADRVIIAGNKRKLLFSSSPELADLNLSELSITSGEEMRVFSVSKIQELLNSGKADVTSIEKREEVLSLTNGDYTLEMSVGCPPDCF